MSSESFTVPKSAVKRAWRRHWLAGAIGVVLVYLLRPGASLISLVGSAVLVGALVYFAYRATLRHVWVTLTEEGMLGRDQTHQELEFKWDEPVVVEARSKFGFKGVVVRSSGEAGGSKRRAGVLFIPSPVLELDSFGAVLARVAPALHPLRRTVGGAI